MNTEQRTQLLTQLTAGLLASGHFTYLTSDNEVRVRTCDNGKDWKEDGAARRFENEAVIRAVILLSEIEREAASMADESPVTS